MEAAPNVSFFICEVVAREIRNFRGTLTRCQELECWTPARQPRSHTASIRPGPVFATRATQANPARYISQRVVRLDKLVRDQFVGGAAIGSVACANGVGVGATEGVARLVVESDWSVC